MPGAVQDIITRANVGENQLRGFGVASGRILGFSIDLRRHYYNTVRVMVRSVLKATNEDVNI